MNNNANIKEFARQLSDIYEAIEDKKIEAKALIETAKEAGINTKALTKVAKEMLQESSKLLKKYDDEEQLEMFRTEVGIYRMKGLDERRAA